MPEPRYQIVADLRPEVPAELANLILRMMAKQPEDRLASYDELIAALEGIQPDAKDQRSRVCTGSVDEPETSDLPDLPLLDALDPPGAALSIDPSFGSFRFLRTRARSLRFRLMPSARDQLATVEPAGAGHPSAHPQREHRARPRIRR